MENLLTTETKEFQNMKILYKAKKHWLYFVVPCLQMLIGSFGFVCVAFAGGIIKLFGFLLIYIFLKGLFALLLKIKTDIFLTENHLTISKGFFGSTITDIPLNKLEGISLSQNALGKLLNFGSLFVSTGGVHQTYLIKNPLELRSKIIY